MKSLNNVRAAVLNALINAEGKTINIHMHRAPHGTMIGQIKLIEHDPEELTAQFILIIGPQIKLTFAISEVIQAKVTDSNELVSITF